MPEGDRASGASRSGCRSPSGYTFDDTRAWVEQLSRLIGDTVPELVSWEWEVAEARGPDPPRLHAERDQQDARRPVQRAPGAGAPVSVPITWDELDDPDLRPDRWTIADIGERLATSGDPLAPLIGLQQRLPAL